MNDFFFSEIEAAVYCSGCNGCFRHSAVDRRCPRCGGDVHSVDDLPLTETLLVRDPGGIAVREKEEGGDEIDQRLGSRLHVYRLESLIGRGGAGESGPASLGSPEFDCTTSGESLDPLEVASLEVSRTVGFSSGSGTSIGRVTSEMPVDSLREFLPAAGAASGR